MDHSIEVGGDRWAAYFQDLPQDLRQFPTEAADYVARLRRYVVLGLNMNVLDFGCGLGFVAASLAPHIGSLSVWDQVETMRRCAVERARPHSRVRLIDLSDASRLPADRFDLILVNSVVQYMPRSELETWIRVWRELLKPGGAVVLSDVIPPKSGLLRELGDTIWFAARHRVLFTAPNKLLNEYRRYSRTRRSTPMLRLSGGEVEAAAQAAALEATRLPSNLTFRGNRLSYLLRRAA